VTLYIHYTRSCKLRFIVSAGSHRSSELHISPVVPSAHAAPPSPPFPFVLSTPSKLLIQFSDVLATAATATTTVVSRCMEDGVRLPWRCGGGISRGTSCCCRRLCRGPSSCRTAKTPLARVRAHGDDYDGDGYNVDDDDKGLTVVACTL